MGREHRFVCDIAERSDRHVIVVYRHGRAVNLHGVLLPEDTVSVGYFWLDRPYNLYHWLSPEGQTRAHYFNIGVVKQYDGTLLEWDDHAIDVLATPDGQVRVLDEDELPADLEPGLRREIESARDEVLRDIEALVRDSERISSAVLARNGSAPL